MKLNKKGQGALEYLLLIGGAVLIAVIVIALLVGMGSQGKDATQKQGQNAQKAMDIAMPATITNSIIGTCANGTSGKFSISWTKSGGSGTYEAVVEEDGTNKNMSLDNNALTTEGSINLNITDSTLDCSKTYWAFVKTTHNGLTATSNKVLLSW